MLFRLVLVVATVASSLAAGSDAATYECDGLVATIVGTSGDDVLTGTIGDDVIVGLDGNDQIDGSFGVSCEVTQGIP